VKIGLILLGATVVGTAGGYIWSGHSPAAPAAPVVTAVPPMASIDDTPALSAEDRAWSKRGSASPQQSRAVEQSVYYSGCNEVRAAGAAPLYAGQPGYRASMDGDGDGIACEPYRGR
jgi:hypothetical protein